MVNSARILTNAARDVVQDIDIPYSGYDADLVKTFTRILQIVRDESSERAQRRAVETLLHGLASEVNARTEDA